MNIPIDNPFFRAGTCGEQSCPTLCLALESFCCLGISMSSSRIYVMDMFDLRPDPCDNRIVRFTNCLMCFACILDVIAIFVPCCRDTAHHIQTLANMVFYTTIGCMAAQVSHEVDYRRGYVEVSFHQPHEVTSPILDTGHVIKIDEAYQGKDII